MTQCISPSQSCYFLEWHDVANCSVESGYPSCGFELFSWCRDEVFCASAPFTTLSLMAGVRCLRGGRGALGSFPQATPDAKSIFKQSCRPALEWNWHRDLICAASDHGAELIISQKKRTVSQAFGKWLRKASSFLNDV